MLTQLTISTAGVGMMDISRDINQCLAHAPQDEGLCTVFIQHTSASLAIQENADPSVQTDILSWLNRIAPESDPNYTHTMEGADDMPAHLKCLMTQTSLTIPYQRHQLLLGTWQGVYLLEHRYRPHQRKLVVHAAP